MDNVRDVFTVHKDWRVPRETRWRTSALQAQNQSQNPKSPISEPSKPTSSRQAVRPFEFVNSSTPAGNKDSNVRKLVRTHVRKDYLWRKRPRKSSPPTPPLISATAIEEGSNRDPKQDSNLIVPRLLGLPTALSTSTFPIPMPSSHHTLLSRYLTHMGSRMYPLFHQASPDILRSQEWFRFAVHDAAMLHAMLYAGAVYLALLEGKSDSEESMFHLGKIIELVNRRLREERGNGVVEDGVIGALSCLALGEANTGHLDLWRIHMRGIKEIISIRGTMSSLPPVIQRKLHRSDITGAIDYAAQPFLSSPTNKTTLSISSILPTSLVRRITSTIWSILTRARIHPDLTSIITHLALFTQTLLFTIYSSPKVHLDPIVLSEDIYWLKYLLLSFPPAAQSTPPLESSVKTASLLYLKTILSEFPHSLTGTKILLPMLKTALTQIPQHPQEPENNEEILRWCCGIGEAASPSGEDKNWFGGKRIFLNTGRLDEEGLEELLSLKMLGFRWTSS